jgi:hypothetical protein
MFTRVRQFLESIVFAGMKPGAPAVQQKRPGLFATFEQWLSPTAPSDPLYLTNRTLAQKLKVWILVGIPCLGLAAVVTMAGLGFFQKDTPPPKEPTGAELAAKMLPDLKGLTLDTNKDVELVEVHINRGDSPVLTGKLRNLTDRTIRKTEIVFDVTDSNGSQLGAFRAEVYDVNAKATKTFEIPVKPRRAATALVREVHTQ